MITVKYKVNFKLQHYGKVDNIIGWLIGYINLVFWLFLVLWFWVFCQLVYIYSVVRFRLFDPVSVGRLDKVWLFVNWLSLEFGWPLHNLCILTNTVIFNITPIVLSCLVGLIFCLIWPPTKEMWYFLLIS